MSDTSISDLKNELFGATLDGAKAGVAANIGAKITRMVVKSTGVELPAFLQTGLGKDILPILVCYAIAFLTVVVPGIPAADSVRRYCILCARGSATILMGNANFMEPIQDMMTFIKGLSANEPLEVPK